MIVNMLAAALAGILIPIVLDHFGADPAIASGTFVTTVTDVVGFFAFLGLASWWFHFLSRDPAAATVPARHAVSLTSLRNLGQAWRAWNWEAWPQMREHYTITELTREFGISTRTIRFYEDEGLIAPIRRGRTRLFRHSDRQLLSNILRGKRLGFSIAEIREIIAMYKARPARRGSCGRSSRGRRARASFEQKKRDIEDLLRELDAAEEACLTRMAELGIGQRARSG